MAHAYTPGLRVSPRTTLRKVRRLPLTGEVKVSVGDQVKAADIVARTELPGAVTPYNIVNTLGVVAEDAPHVMVKEIGEKVEADEVIAESSSFFGLFTSRAKAPVSGTLESVSEVTGQVIIRQPPTPLELKAYVDGKVVEVLEEEGVIVETHGAFIQGIFGIGGETNAEIVMAVDNPSETLDETKITSEMAGKAIVGGNMVTISGIKKAIDVGVKGIIVGGINDTDIKELLGYEIGVAITGSEDIEVTIVVTEGFGEIAMAERTFELLKQNVGNQASINGATQIRAGVIRPEVIVPMDVESDQKAVSEVVAGAMETGTKIRVIREPYFGKIGTVTDLPPKLEPLPTEAHVRILRAQLEDGEEVVLPRANVEIIEEA